MGNIGLPELAIIVPLVVVVTLLTVRGVRSRKRNKALAPPNGYYVQPPMPPPVQPPYGQQYQQPTPPPYGQPYQQGGPPQQPPYRPQGR